MKSKEILGYALELNSEERFMIVEGLLNSLDEPDKSIDKIWGIEAEKRLKAYRGGKLRGVSFKDVFGE